MYIFEITASGGASTRSAVFAITISTKPAGAFNIFGVTTVNTIPSAETLQAISASFARIEAIIVDDQPVFNEPTSNADTSCSGNFPIFYGQAIDDFAIIVNVRPIDGVGGVLGSAGGCGFIRPSAPTFVTGQLNLDEADIVSQSPQSRFDIMFHEIVHALGFTPSIWEGLGLATGTENNGLNPRYTGPEAVAEFIAAGGAGADFPIEADFGAGSAYSHWDEAFFNEELMTPAKEVVLFNPISRITIAAIGELGWGSVFTTADPYVIPACSPNCAPPPGAPGLGRGLLRDVILEEPVYLMGPDGTVRMIDLREGVPGGR